MRLSKAILFSLCFFGVLSNTQGQSVAQLKDNIFLIHGTKCSIPGMGTDAEPKQTGFKIKTESIEGVLTALHGVCNCEVITGRTPTGKPMLLTIQYIDVERDVAILGAPNLAALHPSSVEVFPDLSADAIIDQQVKVYGHAIGAFSQLMERAYVYDDEPFLPLGNRLGGEIKKSLFNRKSPTLDQVVVWINGTLGHGFSGAPVVLDGKVIGIASGGLHQVNVNTSWAIPLNMNEWKLEKVGEGGLAAMGDHVSRVMNQSPYEALYMYTESIFTNPPVAFDRSDTTNSYRVLVLPVKRPDTPEGKLANETFKKELEEKLSKGTTKNINIIYLEDEEFAPASFSQARLFGDELNADLVVYGDYFENAEDAALKFSVTTNNLKPKNNSRSHAEDDDMNASNNLVTIEQGYLQGGVDYLMSYFEGKSEFDEGDNEGAIEYWKEKLPKDSRAGSETVYRSLAVAYQKIENYSEAAHYFEEALRIDPNNATTIANLAYNRMMLGAGAQTTVERYRHSLSLDPYQAVTLNNLGILLMDSLEDYNGALKALTESLQIEPNNVFALNAMGSLFILTNQLQRAEKAYQITLKVDPTFHYTHYNYGNLLRDFGRYKESEASFLKAIEHDPLQPKYRKNLGLLYYAQLNDYMSAYSVFDEMIRLFPNHPDGYLGMSQINWSDPLKSHAVAAVLDSGLAHCPSSWELHWIKAKHLWEIFKDKAGALRHYNEATRLNPNDKTVRSEFGLFLVTGLQNADLAEKHYLEWHAMDPSNAYVNQMLGYVYASMKNAPEKSLPYLKKGTELKPNDGRGWFNYATNLGVSGKKEEAKAAYLKAVSLMPEMKTLENDAYFLGEE